MVLSFPGYLLDVAYRQCESYSSDRSQAFSHRVSPRLFYSLGSQCFRVLRDATQLWYNFHNSHSILVVAFSSFMGIVAFLWLFIRLFINLVKRKKTLASSLTTRFIFIEIDTREDANTHKPIACKYLSINICTVVEEWTMVTCASDTSLPRHTSTLVSLMAQKVWRQCVLFWAHELGSRGGNRNGLLADTGLFLSTGNGRIFLYSHLVQTFQDIIGGNL